MESGIAENEKYRGMRVSDEEIVDVMTELTEATGKEIMFFGGNVVIPPLLGYRHMRRPSQDFDCLTTENAIEKVHEEMKGVSEIFYEEDRGEVFMDFRGYPVGFHTDRIHDWKVPKDFAERATRIKANGGEIAVSSPEYLAALKIRRANCKGRFFGKDCIDIGNMLIAPMYRNGEIREMDYERTADLIYTHVTRDPETARSWLDEVAYFVRNANREERAAFGEVYTKLRDAVERRFGGNAGSAGCYFTQNSASLD